MDEALTDSTYLILLALLKPKHGYLIMKQIHELSQGTFEIGPATMYTILKKLTKKGWIDLEESVDRKNLSDYTRRKTSSGERYSTAQIILPNRRTGFRSVRGEQDGHQ